MKNNEGTGCALIFILVLAALSLCVSYWIAVSDLPEWFKFWLLK